MTVKYFEHTSANQSLIFYALALQWIVDF